MPGALAALDEALSLDPYDYVALLSKGAVVERMSGERAAAPVYRNASALAPPEDEMPPQLRAPTERARQVVADTTEALEAHLRPDRRGEGRNVGRRRGAGSTRASASTPAAPRSTSRSRCCCTIRGCRRSRSTTARCSPGCAEVEAATETIRGELAAALEAAKDDFAPYIAYPKGAPVNQWGELNHSPRWSSFFLWKDGVRQDAACALLPEDRGAPGAACRMADQPGFAPTAMFSALEAHTRIPPHTGSTNVRLLCHLPLILPGRRGSGWAARRAPGSWARPGCSTTPSSTRPGTTPTSCG